MSLGKLAFYELFHSAIRDVYTQVLTRQIKGREDKPFSSAERERLASMIDSVLVQDYPFAMLLREKDRRTIILRVIGLILEVAYGAPGGRRKAEPALSKDFELPVELLFGVGLEGFEVEVASEDVDLEEIAERVLDAGYRVEPDLAVRNLFMVVCPDLRHAAISRIFDLARELKESPGVVWVEPDISIPSRENTQIDPELDDAPPAIDRAAVGLGSYGNHFDETENKFGWCLERIEVGDAWDYSVGSGGGTKGEGVVVGHPDTGYLDHPELESTSLKLDGAYDFWKNDPHAKDDRTGTWSSIFRAGFKANPGHGTRTGTVIVSRVEGDVKGVAPQAQLMPFRVTPTVVLFNKNRLAKAIRRAVDEGCAVISISLGGPGIGRRLKQALAYAEEQGVIVCAAAGNNVGFVVQPAKSPTVVACAASNYEDKAWPGSSCGSSVTITAPGHDVYTANPDEGAAEKVKRSAGTSFAVAHVAGVAALWVSHHGGQRALAGKLGGRFRIPAEFRRILKEEGFRRPAGIRWADGKFGSGLISAYRVLKARLSEFPRAAAVAEPSELASLLRETALIDEQVDMPDVGVLDQRIAQSFGDDLSLLEDELIFRCGTSQEFRRRLCRQLTDPSGDRAASAQDVEDAPGPVSEALSAYLRQ